MQPWEGAESGLVAYGISISYQGQTPCVAGTEAGAGVALRAPGLLACDAVRGVTQATDTHLTRRPGALNGEESGRGLSLLMSLREFLPQAEAPSHSQRDQGSTGEAGTCHFRCLSFTLSCRVQSRHQLPGVDPQVSTGG